MNLTYFTGKISPDLTYLYISRTIVYFSNGFFAIFVPIFLYEMLGYNIQKVLLFYLIGSFLYLLPLPTTTKYIERFSLKRSLYIATIADVLFLLVLIYLQCFFQTLLLVLRIHYYPTLPLVYPPFDITYLCHYSFIIIWNS